MARMLPLLVVALPLSACSDDGPRSRVADAGPSDAAVAVDAAADAGYAAHCEWEAPDPVPAGRVERADLSAGAAETVLDLPVGTPLGGYLGRSTTIFGLAESIDGRTSPFADSLVPSAGIQTRIPVRAVVLEAGGEVLFLVKADIPLAFDGTLFSIEEEIERRTGVPARGRVLLAVSHSHSGWGRTNGHFLYQNGMDLWQAEAVEALVDAATNAAAEAFESREPARIGFGTWDDWDPDDRVYRDRRNENDALSGGRHKDPRLLVLRVDRADGRPLALIHSFGMHGTIADEGSPYVSVDASGHLDLELEERFDEPVVVMHLQGAAGDASPVGVRSVDDTCSVDADCADVTSVDPEPGCSGGECRQVVDFGRMESIGEIAAPRILALHGAVAAGAGQVEIEVVSRSVPIGPWITVERGWGLLAYPPYDPGARADAQILDGDGRVATPLDEFGFQFGAFGCGGETGLIPGWGVPGTEGLAPYGSCVDLSLLTTLAEPMIGLAPPELPLCETMSAPIAVLRIGGLERTVFDGSAARTETESELVVAFLPGEPTALLAEAFRSRSPAGEGGSWVVGYALDYKGYLLLVEDWLAGGYEPSVGVWGPLEGEYLLEQVLELASLASTPDREDAERGFLRRTVGSPPRLDHQPDTTIPEAAPVPPPGGLLTRLRAIAGNGQPAAVVPRVTGRAEVVWAGGDPGVDPARVGLERLMDDGSFAPVLRRSGRAVDDRGKEILVIYTPWPLDGDGPREHYYVAEWQAVTWEGDAEHTALEDFAAVPAGTYRLRMRGRYFDGQRVRDYDLASAPFEVVPVELDVSATIGETGDDTVTATASYPAGAGYRLLDLEAVSNGPVPLRGSARIYLLDAAGKTLASDEVGATVEGSRALFRLPARPGIQSVRVTDRFGNSGEGSVTP